MSCKRRMASRIIKGIGWTSLGSITRNVVNLLQIIILTRFLEKEDFGIVAIATLFVAFTMLFLDMGISAGILYKREISKQEYSSLFWTNIIFGISLTLLLFFVSPIITSKYNTPDLTEVVRILCFNILLNSIGAQQRAFCQKKMYFKRLSIIEILGGCTTLIVAITTAILGYGVYSLAYSSLSGYLVGNLSHLVVALKKDSRLSFHFRIREVLPFMKIGIYQVGSSILDFLTREIDILILSATLGLDFVGVYNIAKKIPSALYTLIQPIVGTVFTPMLAELNHNIRLVKDKYVEMSKSLAFISLPLYFGIAAVSPTIICYVFGLNYMEGVPVMIVFCIKYAFNGFNGICGSLQVALGRTDIGLKWTIYLILSTTVSYYITSLYGITYFLIGVVVMIFVNLVVGWYMQFRVLVEIKWIDYVKIFVTPFLISSILSVLVYIVVPTGSVLLSVIALAFSMFLYLLLLSRTKDEFIINELIYRLPIKGEFKNKMLGILHYGRKKN